ncbi:hypothetical protein C9994_00075 [Marivirga lumbricoides]|uniref:Uncharacterized protein n=1 Tax=Marivirga lumbricoides TaxID=1046115 RepID=A0A2T4DW00_9BACT|nr:hypothetical protein C9994_00075 [Marivirga lumbricoides]
MDKDAAIFGLIKEIINQRTSEDDLTTIAEIFSEEVNSLVRTRDSNTALTSAHLVSRIRPSHINVPVKSTGLDYSNDFDYRPQSWLYLSPSSGLKKAEPLAISWMNGNHTTLQPDQRFLSVYGLSPRLTNDATFWDDLSKPQYNIVENKPLSIYEYPFHSEAYIKINRKYLRDYLSIRKKVAVLIYREIRDVEINNDILYLLDQKEYFIKEYDQYEVRLSRYDHKDNIARLEVNGYNVIFENDDNRGEEKPFIEHFWKGIDRPVTGYESRDRRSFEYVYVSDDVLAKYEDDDDYDVQPESGGVSYGIHWGVLHCDRVGRNAIRIELKKLYEGTPYDVIEYWNQFSINPETINKDEENIAEKSTRLVRKYLLFGRVLSSLVNRVCDFYFHSPELISLDEKILEYKGYAQDQDVRPIMNHVSSKSFTKDKFISRCKKLNILLVENIREKNLRKVVDHLGFPLKETEKLRSIKLLELILKYFFVAQDSGLHPKHSREAILTRIDEFKDLVTIPEVLALNTIRQLDAHKSKDFNSKFAKALDSLGIERKSITNNYSEACHEVYDALINMFSDLNSFLVGAYDFKE